MFEIFEAKLGLIKGEFGVFDGDFGGGEALLEVVELGGGGEDGVLEVFESFGGGDGFALEARGLLLGVFEAVVEAFDALGEVDLALTFASDLDFLVGEACVLGFDFGFEVCDGGGEAFVFGLEGGVIFEGGGTAFVEGIDLFLEAGKEWRKGVGFGGELFEVFFGAQELALFGFLFLDDGA